MTSTTANNNPVTPQMIQSSAFQSVVRNQQSLESANGNVSSFLLTNVSAANSENLLSSIPNTRPHTNTDLVQQEQTISSSSPSSNLCSKIVRVLRDDDGTRRSESPSTAADCQKIANSASSSETNFSNAAVAPPLPPPSDCLARLETPDCLYFVCKKRLVIGRETAHSTADVSFKKTFVSRAHLELTFVASSMNAAAFAATTKDYDEAEEDDDDDETTSQDDGVWLLKCNGKNGILINNSKYYPNNSSTIFLLKSLHKSSFKRFSIVVVSENALGEFRNENDESTVNERANALTVAHDDEQK
uniref:FHA domain-containing protein n=1 Tax=Romanomermis culicivorax TaxID=13658 RepID=A0A915JBB9_ROMCU